MHALAQSVQVLTVIITTDKVCFRYYASIPLPAFAVFLVPREVGAGVCLDGQIAEGFRMRYLRLDQLQSRGTWFDSQRLLVLLE